MSTNGPTTVPNPTKRPLQPLMPQPANSRPALTGGGGQRTRNNTQTTGTPSPAQGVNPLKARVNLSESLIDSSASPFAAHSTPTSAHSTPRVQAQAGSSPGGNYSPNLNTPTDNIKRIRSPITQDTRTFPTSKQYGSSPTLQAPMPTGRPVARSGATPVARSALSPEALSSSSASSTTSNASSSSVASSAPAKRTVKASVSGARLMPSANISPLAPTFNARATSDATSASNARAFARSPSPARQPPSPKRPHAAVTRTATAGPPTTSSTAASAASSTKPASSSYLTSPPLRSSLRSQPSVPALRASVSNPNLSRPARASAFQPPNSEALAARKQSSSASSSSSQSIPPTSAGARTPKSPNPDLPPDGASTVSAAVAPTHRQQEHRPSSSSNGPPPTATLSRSSGDDPLQQGATAGLGVSLNGVLDEEDLKEIERAKEREKEARENRKVLDLEITNASLLAINAMLERAKQKQSSEISSLRRKLREGPVFLPSPMPTSPGVSSSASSFGLNGEPLDYEVEGEEEEDWSTILSRDPEFGHIAKCLESLVEEGQHAIDASAQDVEQKKVGLKVVSRFHEPEEDTAADGAEEDEDEEGFDEDDSAFLDESSSFVDDSILSIDDPSPLRHRKVSQLAKPARRPSRLRVSSLTSAAAADGEAKAAATTTRDRGVQANPGGLEVPCDGEASADRSTLLNTSAISDFSEPEAWCRGIASPTSSAAHTRVQSTPLPSIPASPSGPRPSASSIVSDSQSQNNNSSSSSDSTKKILPPDIALPQSPPPSSQQSSAMSAMAGFLGWNSTPSA